MRRIGWSVAAVAIPYALFEASLSFDFYKATSPPDWSTHVVLRKIFSVGAFALVTFLMGGALREWGRPLATRTIVVLGSAYSGSIEIAQYFQGSQEGVAWNAFDVACGALGGRIAARALVRGNRPQRSRARTVGARYRNTIRGARPEAIDSRGTRMPGMHQSGD